MRFWHSSKTFYPKIEIPHDAIHRMHHDAWGHVSRFLEPSELQEMATLSIRFASIIRHTYRSISQKEPVLKWNRLMKQFHIDHMIQYNFLHINLQHFGYLEHIPLLFRIIRANQVTDLIIESDPLVELTPLHRTQLIQEITTMNPLQAIVLRGLHIDDETYERMKAALCPVFPNLPLRYVALTNGRYINEHECAW